MTEHTFFETMNSSDDVIQDMREHIEKRLRDVRVFPLCPTEFWKRTNALLAVDTVLADELEMRKQ